MSLIPILHWSLQSPDGTVWKPTITRAGIVTFTAGGPILTTDPPIFPGSPDPPNIWTPSIDNSGLVTITSGLDAGQSPAALQAP